MVGYAVKIISAKQTTHNYEFLIEQADKKNHLFTFYNAYLTICFKL